MTLDDYTNAGFIQEGWPEDLPLPGEETIEVEPLEDNLHRYTYSVEKDGTRYAACVEINHDILEVPAEGVVFMLNQFAYLFRSKPDRIEVKEDGEIYKTNF